jgi:hypothetical protein
VVERLESKFTGLELLLPARVVILALLVLAATEQQRLGRRGMA